MPRTEAEVTVHRWWYNTAWVVIRTLGATLYRLRVSGAENVPREGGLLGVSNHQSHLDPPLIGAASPRQMVFLARSGLFKFGPFAWLIRSYGAIPLNQEAPPVTALRISMKQLKQGRMLLMFPEGSRSHDGQIHPFKPGFAALARRAGVPVQPIAVEGAYRAWPRWRRLPRPGVVHVHFGEPISHAQLAPLSDEDAAGLVESVIRESWEMLRQRPAFRYRWNADA